MVSEGEGAGENAPPITFVIRLTEPSEISILYIFAIPVMSEEKKKPRRFPLSILLLLAILAGYVLKDRVNACDFEATDGVFTLNCSGAQK